MQLLQLQRTQIILLLIGLIVLSGCNALSRAGSEPEAEVIATQVTAQPATQAPQPPNIDTQTHTDTSVGFSFDYPADWFITGGNPPADAISYSITISTTDPNTGGQDGVVGSKIDVIVEPVPDGFTLNPARLETDANAGASQTEITDIEARTLSNGQPALYYKSRSLNFGNVATIIETLVNGHVIRFAALGDSQDEFIDLVANSLRPN